MEDAVGKNDTLAPWVGRRRLITAVTVFCMATIAYCLVTRLDSKVAESAVTMAFTTLMAVTGSYVFGATWDDKRSGKPGA